MVNITITLDSAVAYAETWIYRAVNEELSSYAPVFALLGHVGLALLIGLLYRLCCLSVRDRNTKNRMSCRSFVIIMMRLEKELRSTTIIAAGSLTVILIAMPEPLHMTLLIVAVVIFALTSFLLHAHALFRMQYKKANKMQDRVDHKVRDDAIRLEQEDVALCFVLNSYWAFGYARVLRTLLVAALVAVLFLAVFLSTAPSRVKVATESLTLLLLIMRETGQFMTEGFRKADWNYKHYSRAMLRRAMAESEAQTKENARIYQSAPLKIAPSQICFEPSYRKSTLLLTAREVVLHESTKLAWADHRFEDKLTNVEFAQIKQQADHKIAEARRADKEDSNFRPEGPLTARTQKQIEERHVLGSYFTASGVKGPKETVHGSGANRDRCGNSPGYVQDV